MTSPLTVTERGTIASAAWEINWKNPSKIDDEVLSRFVSAQYDAGKERRAAWERSATLQLQWAEGYQSSRRDPDGLDLQERLSNMQRELRFEEEREVQINGIRRIILQRIALLLGQPVTLYASPVSNDDDDVSAAKLQTKLLQYMWHGGSNPIRPRLPKALWDMFCTGLVVIFTHWDPYAGEPDEFVSDDPQEGKEHLPPGEVNMEFVLGFDITEPEFCTTMPTADWIIHSRWRSMEYMVHRYGKAADELIPNANTEAYLHSWRSMYGPTPELAGEVATGAVKSELILEHTMWRPVSPWCPAGAKVCVAQDVVLAKGPNPYSHGQLPFVKMDENPSQYFRPTGTAHDLTTLQFARNSMRSQGQNHVYKTVAPKIVKERSVALADDAFDSQDRLIDVPDGALQNNKIRPWQANPFPGQLIQLDEAARRDMMDIGGVHDSTTGRGESRSQSGRHAALLLQSDSRGNLTTRELVETALAFAGQQALWLWFQYVKTDRTIEVAGENGAIDVIQFKGEGLFGKRRPGRRIGPHTFNVRVTLGPDNQPEQVIDKVEMMTQMGYWSPQRPADRMRVARMIGDRVTSENDAESAQRRNANAEHVRAMRGDAIRAVVGDDDDIHIEEHERFTTTEEYRQKTGKDPRLELRLSVHRREHMRQKADKLLRPAMVMEHTKQLILQELAADLPHGATAPPPGNAGNVGRLQGMIPQQVPPSMGGGLPTVGGDSASTIAGADEVAAAGGVPGVM